MGSFSLNVHHTYDPIAKILYSGNGKQRRASATTNAVINTVVGNGIQGFSGDGGLAKEASLYYPTDIAFGPDGSLYILDYGNGVIRRVGADGLINTVAAGNGTGIAFSPDGSLYIVNRGSHRIYRVGADGIINKVVGGGHYFGYGFGDGGLATEATLFYPTDIAFGPDGSLYIADYHNHRIRRVGADGIINTVAGNHNYGDYGGNGLWNIGGFGGDGRLATRARLSFPISIAFGPDGSLYIADYRNSRIRRVSVDGIINTVAGNRNKGFSGDGRLATKASLYDPVDIAFGPDGSLYIADYHNHRIRRVGVDGIINTMAGNGLEGFSGDGGLATKASLAYPSDIAFGPDGNLYIADNWNHRIRRVGPALPRFSLGNIILPSEEGALLGC